MSDTKTAEKTKAKKTNPEQEKALKAIESLINSTKPTSFGEVSVERRGDKIVLPENMSYNQAHEWLHDIEEQEETLVDISYTIDCYPLDGALALYKVLMGVYGHVKMNAQSGFFGPQPPQMITIKTGVDSRVNVPWGKLTLPGLDGYIRSGVSQGTLPKYMISGEIKRKHEGAMRRIIEKTEAYVKENSIYRGKAIRVDMSSLAAGEFHPLNDAPKFFDVQSIKASDLILNKSTTFNLQVALWNRLENGEALKANNVNLKHGTLLMGTYGTGKTMTAKVTAKKAEDNGWTFIYLESPDQFADALRLAELYAPAVLFAEDIDKVMEGSERDHSMNRILNTMDGVDTKDKPIITVLTTNHPEKINKAFLRAGRIDSVIPMGKPDSEAAIRFVEYYTGPALAADQDLTKVGEILEGFVPAFIDQAVEKAKQYAIGRVGANIEGAVTADDIVDAAATLQEHQDLVADNNQPTPEERFTQAAKTMHKHLHGKTEDEIGELYDRIM